MTDMTDLAGALSPVVEARGLELVDVEVHGAQLTVFVDQLEAPRLHDRRQGAGQVRHLRHPCHLLRLHS